MTKKTASKGQKLMDQLAAAATTPKEFLPLASFRVVCSDSDSYWFELPSKTRNGDDFEVKLEIKNRKTGEVFTPNAHLCSY